jgi:hypothetical protein
MLPNSFNAVDITASLQDRIVSLAIQKGDVKGDNVIDVSKKYLLLAGVMAECLMDFEDPFCELRRFQFELIGDCLEHEAFLNHDEIPHVTAVELDKQLEWGRSLSRLYLDDEEASCRSLKAAIQNILEHDRDYAPFSKETKVAQIMFFVRAVHMALAFEVIAHLFCDRVIDSKIAQDDWTASDCLMAMSGLAGRYYAFAAIEEEDVAHYEGVRLHSDDWRESSKVMLDMIAAEALRMGVAESGDLLKTIAANDIEYRAFPHLIYSLEPAFAILADKYELEGYAVKSIAVAKSVGRMIAVACAGEDAEVEHNIAKPLTVSSFIGSLQHYYA